MFNCLFNYILKKAQENFDSLDKKNILRVYPFVYFIAFATYALILFIEKVAFDSHALIEHDHGDGHGHEHEHNHGQGNEHGDLHENHNNNQNNKHIQGEINKSKYELKSHVDENCKHLILF